MQISAMWGVLSCVLQILASMTMTVYAVPVRRNSPAVVDILLRDAAPKVLNIEQRPGARKGERLVEMDMLLTREQYDSIHGGKRAHKVGRISLGDESYRWTDATIPYEIDNVFNEDQRNLILRGMEHWEKYTCVKFIPRQNEQNYLRIMSGSGCWSMVGMVGGMQELSLDIAGCVLRHLVVHELGHTIGFHHEQTRPDRDNYITVLEENISSGQEYNFEKYEWGFLRNFGIKYDYWSVMHYGEYAFTRNGQRTIETKDRKFQSIIGTVPGASLKDIQTVNLMYRCSEHCDKTRCPSTAILSEDCKCWCNTGNPGNPVVEWDGQGDCKSLDHQPSDTCLDYDDSCARWAQEGQCETNTNYMLMNCRRSCKVCGPDAVCRNFNDQCSYWALIGECESNPGWMLTNCMQACTVCGDNPVRPNFRDCRDVSDMCAGAAAGRDCERYAESMLLRCPVSCRACQSRTDFVCRNWHIECSAWADYGRCNTEPDWMRRHCPAACRFCPQSVVPDCKNYAADEECKRWKAEGECGNNPRWMLFFCAESCRSCGPDKVCQDRRPECPDLQERGWCEDEDQRVSMYFTCPVSCGHCQPDSPNTGSCRNFDPDCSTWKGLGWCDSNPNLMLWHCPRACSICGSNPVCKDYNEKCAQWQREGECESNPIWMHIHCAKSCSTCPKPDEMDKGGGGNDGDGGTDGGNGGNGDDDSMQGDETDEGDCVDFLDWAFCQRLASQGYCLSSPDYMLPNCMRSCKTCGKGSNCMDYNENCKTWANSDQCLDNPGYMNLFCKWSCSQCGDGGGTGGDGSGEVDPLQPDANTCPELQEWCERSPDEAFCSDSLPCNTDSTATNCPFSCGLCGPNPSCKNYHEHCPTWAEYGECDRNPGYMRIFCRASCKCC